jgi:O-acetyl-ADP-ribose deacetylase (regulator of RNase III)
MKRGADGGTGRHPPRFSVIAPPTANMEFLTVQGDVTDQVADALVNSVNSSCRLEHGVARAFREAAGEELQDALLAAAPDVPEWDARALRESAGGPGAAADTETAAGPDGGEVFVTDAFALDAECVVHAVAVPLDTGATAESIRASTANALAAADERGCRSLAMPVVGGGIGGFGYREAARIICEALADYEADRLSEALLVGYSAEEHETLRSVAWEQRTG